MIDVLAAVRETTEQSERELACRVVEAQRCSPGKVVELRPEQLFEYLAGSLVLVDVPSTADSPGPVGGLVRVGLTERPFK